MIKTFAITALSILSIAGGNAAAAQSATTLLFETPHLAQLESGTTLSYAFEHQAGEEALGADFEDTIEVTLVESGEPGKFNAQVQLFTGERHRAAGPFSNMTGNPVIMLFLEHDVLEMNRHLEGNAFYIRNRIKDALRSATAEQVQIDFEGETLEGWKIVLEPFVNERDKPRLNRFADKRYEIVLAEGIPGAVYEMRASTPAPESTEPLVSDVLTLVEAADDDAAGD